MPQCASCRSSDGLQVTKALFPSLVLSRPVQPALLNEGTPDRCGLSLSALDCQLGFILGLADAYTEFQLSRLWSVRSARSKVPGGKILAFGTSFSLTVCCQGRWSTPTHSERARSGGVRCKGPSYLILTSRQVSRVSLCAYWL